MVEKMRKIAENCGKLRKIAQKKISETAEKLRTSIPPPLVGLSPLHILTLCGPERVLVVSTEALDFGEGGYLRRTPLLRWPHCPSLLKCWLASGKQAVPTNAP